MLGKLLKHEFRATGRTMLPLYGAVVILAVLANISIRLMDVADSVFLRILFGLVIVVFVIGIIAAVVVTALVMISRFYRNLLREQGYLMHTLPVTVHGQIWSKLIVSLVWFAATFIVVWLIVLLTGLIQSGTGISSFFISFPSWAEIRQYLAEMGIRPGDVVLLGAEYLANIVAACGLVCLHFYAAMALGHMFSRNKVLMSIVFYVAISIVFSLLTTGSGMVTIRSLEGGAYESLTGAAALLTVLQGVSLRAAAVQLAEGALLYIATVLGLKKGLNLA